MNSTPEFDPTVFTADQRVECDVRPILQAGGEPFSLIMGTLAKVPPDGAMRLRATFKPSPLFNVLGKQGWNHWIERGTGDDWIIWFFRGGTSLGSGPAGRTDDPTHPQDTEVPRDEILLSFLLRDNPELQGRLIAEHAEWILDVRRMSPPEPMEMTLIVLEKLPMGHTLTQLNERIPQFLLPILEERGFEYRIAQNDEAEVRVEIRHR